LVLLSFAVVLAQFAALAVEDNPGDATAAFAPVERGSTFGFAIAM
jgi:hypothetical protein